MHQFNQQTRELVPPRGTPFSIVARGGGLASWLRALRAVFIFTGLAAGIYTFTGPAVAQVGQGTSIEAAFSPREGADELVLKVIGSARRSLRIAAYSFTSPSIAKALLGAKKRGIDVRIVVDHKMNTQHDRFKASRAALDLLATAGIPVRTVDYWPMHHDKYIVADGETVETGSYNYSTNATKSRENVLVIWRNEDLARSYESHWTESWSMGRDYQASY